MAEDVFDSSSESEFEGDTGSTAGDQGGNEPKNEGRTLDNVRGELLRKQERLEQQIASLAEATQKLTDAVMRRGQSPEDGDEPRYDGGISREPRQVLPRHQPRSIEQYTDEQLQRALDSGQLSPVERREVTRVLQERSFDSRLEAKLEERDRAAATTRLEREAEEAALGAFPALRDKNSEFSRRVNAALEQQRAQLGKFPTDKFDVANRVARQMGVEVARVVTPGYVGRPEAAPEPEVDEPQGQSEEEVREIAHGLRYALPIKRNPKTGKMERKKFNLKRIQERSKRYQENESVFKQGRKIRGGGSQ